MNAAGRLALVVASAGTVNTGDFDDLERLRELCIRNGAWLHVDAAFVNWSATGADVATVAEALIACAEV